MKQVRKRLTYSNVMSSIAVFLVLGGATVGGRSARTKSVCTKQLKAGVDRRKLKKNALTTCEDLQEHARAGAKVKDSSANRV